MLVHYYPAIRMSPEWGLTWMAHPKDHQALSSELHPGWETASKQTKTGLFRLSKPEEMIYLMSQEARNKYHLRWKLGFQVLLKIPVYLPWMRTIRVTGTTRSKSFLSWKTQAKKQSHFLTLAWSPCHWGHCTCGSLQKSFHHRWIETLAYCFLTDSNSK